MIFLADFLGGFLSKLYVLFLGKKVHALPEGLARLVGGVGATREYYGQDECLCGHNPLAGDLLQLACQAVIGCG